MAPADFEFLDAAAPIGPDEVLEVGGGHSRAWRVAGVLAATLAVGVAGWQLSTAGSDAPAPRPAAATATMPEGTAGLPAPTPAAGAPDQCPDGVPCSSVARLPAAALRAVSARLVGARLLHTRTVQIVLTSDLRATVWFREIVVRTATATLTVEVRQPRPGDRSEETSSRIGTTHVASVQVVLADRVVTVGLTDDGSGPDLDVLRAIAADGSLMAV
ncbi:MAG: hypothetical protein ABI345_11640 [Jatrophihabitans sp.]